MKERKKIVSNCMDIVLLAVLSLTLGLVIHCFRFRSLSLHYFSPEQRLIQVVQAMDQSKGSNYPGMLPMVSVDELRILLERKEVLLLDARPFLFYRHGHLPSALNLSREEFQKDYQAIKVELESNKKRQVVVYCSGGDCRDSELVGQVLLRLGFLNVTVFEGGYDAWTEANLQIVRE